MTKRHKPSQWYIKPRMIVTFHPGGMWTRSEYTRKAYKKARCQRSWLRFQRCMRIPYGGFIKIHEEMFGKD